MNLLEDSTVQCNILEVRVDVSMQQVASEGQFTVSYVKHEAQNACRILNESSVYVVSIVLLSKMSSLSKRLILLLCAVSFWLMLSNNVSYTQV